MLEIPEPRACAKAKLKGFGEEELWETAEMFWVLVRDNKIKAGACFYDEKHLQDFLIDDPQDFAALAEALKQKAEHGIRAYSVALPAKPRLKLEQALKACGFVAKDDIEVMKRLADEGFELELESNLEGFVT